MSNVIFLIGRSLVLLGTSMGFMVIFAAGYGEPVWIRSFLVSALVTLCIGGAISLAVNVESDSESERRDSILFGIMFWLVLAPFAGLPFYFGGAATSVSASVFEATSGLTTTGATMLSQLEKHSYSILLWRSMLQWFGGLATIVFAVALLSNLGVGAMGASQSHLPRGDDHGLYRRIRHTTIEVVPVYLILTFCATITLIITKVSPFDAVVHAMSAISTGGFSTRDGGLSAFDNPWFSAVVLIWCVIGALNFTVVWAVFHLRRNVFDWDSETRMLVRFGVFAMCTVLVIMIISQDQLTFRSVGSALALVISAITTSGFIIQDGAVSSLPILLFLVFLMLVGPATGSTAGGFKILKAQLLFRLVRRELIRMPNPRSIKLVQYAGTRVNDNFMRAIWVMFGMYIFVIVVGTLGVAAGGVSLETAFPAAITHISNSGAFFGLASDGVHTREALSRSALWVLSGLMVVGRLELLAVLAILTPSFWSS